MLYIQKVFWSKILLVFRMKISTKVIFETMYFSILCRLYCCHSIRRAALSAMLLPRDNASNMLCVIRPNKIYLTCFEKKNDD